MTVIRLDKIEEAFINSHTRNLLQWNLDITKGLGTGKRGFIKSRLFFIYFTTTGAKNIVRYREDFVIQRSVILRFRCICQVC